MFNKEKKSFRKHSIKLDKSNEPIFQKRMSLNSKRKNNQISHYKEENKSILTNDSNDHFLLRNIFL